MASSIPTYNRAPAIFDDTLGATTYNTPSGLNLLFWVKVVDHEGIPEGGTSHQVKVGFPNTTPAGPDAELHLYFARGEDWDDDLNAYRSAFYEAATPLPGNDPMGFDGEYTFTVTDVGNNSSSFSDSLDIQVLDTIPEDATLTIDGANNINEHITATFDDVEVGDGSGGLLPYDNFDTYVDLHEAVAYGNWWYGNGDVSILGGKLQMSTGNTVGRGNAHLRFADPDTINDIKVDITIPSPGDISTLNGPPRARISGYWFNNDAHDCWVSLNVKGDSVDYSITEEIVGTNYNWNVLREGTLLTGLTPGTTVTARVRWNAGTLTVSADDGVTSKDESYTPGSTAPLTQNEKNLQVRTNLISTVTPTFSWTGVLNASHYRVRIYNWNRTKTIHMGYPGDVTTYQVPPGVLEPNGYYQFRVEARGEHQWLDLDNWSRTNIHRFYTDSDQEEAPFIYLDASGVQTWNGDRLGDYLQFWVKIHDAQGVPENIRSVRVAIPGGQLEELYYDSNWYPGATSGIYRGFTFQPVPVAGTYTFYVTDWDGNSFSIEEPLNPQAPIGFPDIDNVSPSDAGGAIIPSDGVINVSWDAVSGAAFYRLEIFNEEYKRVYAFPVPASPEPDYTLQAGLFEPGKIYRYRIVTRREFFEQNVDNVSSSPWDFDVMPVLMSESVNGDSTPDIDLDGMGAAVLHTIDPRNDGSLYMLQLTVKVTDGDGVPGNISSVTATGPGAIGTVPLRFDGAYSPNEGRYYGEVMLTDPNAAGGDFTFTVEDFDGNTAGVGPDTVVVNILPIPTGLRPVDDIDVPSTTPVFDWDDVDGVAAYKVQLWDGWNRIHSSDALSISYYPVPDGVGLQERTVYNYRVDAYGEDPAGEVDNISSSLRFSALRPHFMPTAMIDNDPGGPDGMDDMWEIRNFGSESITNAGTDWDSDGLLDVDEYDRWTDPTSDDTDGDGMLDGWEVANGYDPLTDDAGALSTTGLTTDPVSDSEIDLSWALIIDPDVTISYKVEYAVNNYGPWHEFGTYDEAGLVLPVRVNGLMPFTVYYFRVQASFDGVPGPYSEEAAAATHALPRPASYSLSDLQGTWHAHALVSGDAPEWTGWEAVTLTIDGTGNANIIGTDSTDDSIITEESFQLTEDGLFMIDNGMNHHGILNTARDMLIITSDQEDGGNWLGVALKVDPTVTYNASDLVGTWRTLFLTSGDSPGNPNYPGWWHGEITVETNGDFSGTGQHYDGTSTPQSGTLVIDSGGVVTAVSDSSFSGFMNGDKDLIVHTFNDGGGGYNLALTIKQDPAVTFTQTDRVGTWFGHALTAGDGSSIEPGSTHEPGWAYLTRMYSGGSDVAVSGVNHNGQFIAGIFPANLSLDVTGILTDSTDPSFYGVMSRDKTLLVATRTESPKDHPELSIFIRRTDDRDGDGMEDDWEWAYFGDLDQDDTTDFDEDGLNDIDEFLLGTNPDNNDTDGDGMPDGWEVDNVLDPLLDDSAEDPDVDGLYNGDEYNYGTDPGNADTDSDGLTDGDDEVYYYGTDPANPDTDGDGLTDGDEVDPHGTDPTYPDTDRDGLTDGDEVNTFGTDPLDDDSDADGLSDGDEVYNYGTEPTNPDTDGDDLSDGDEVNTHGTSPLNDDTDGDALTDSKEIADHGTDPTLADTDGDLVDDGTEIAFSTDPNDAHSFPVMPGIYYVDIDHPNASNDSQHGTSSATPWKTLHYAFARLDEGTPGDYTLYVGLGTYVIGAEEEPDEPLILDQDNVTIIGESGSMPVVDGTGASAWDYGVWLKGNGTSIENVEVRSFPDYGIKIESGNNMAVRGCVVHSMTDAYGWGILVNGADDAVVENCSTSNQYGGVAVYDSDGMVSNNRIHDTDIGIHAASWILPTAPSIQNNLVVTSLSNAIGIYLETGTGGRVDPLIYHNTLVGPGDASGDGIYIENSGGDANPSIYYNIITKWDYGINNVGGTPVNDFNDLYDNGTDYDSVLPGENDIGYDPRFIDPAGGNYDLAGGSPCIDAIPRTVGDPVNTDLIGRPRPNNGGFDMGCYEATGPANSPPAAPTAQGGMGIVEDGPVTLLGSGYSDPDGDSHYATHWMVRRVDRPYGAPGYPVTFDAMVTSGEMEEHILNALKQGMQYEWRVGYEDEVGNIAWSNVAVFTYGTPEIDEEVEVLEGSEPEDFQMVSFPSWPVNNDAEAALNIEYDDTLYRIGTYNPIVGAYVECGNGLIIEPGRAYWMLARQGFSPKVNGVPLVSDEDVEVKLLYNPSSFNGWNMIAAPNGYDYNWGDVQVVEYDGDGMPTGGTPKLIDELAEENPWVDKRLWRWEEGSGTYFSDTLVMEHHRGYWVKARKQNVYLRFAHSHQLVQLTWPGNVQLAMRETVRRMVDSWVLSPTAAFADASDQPPSPMGGFAGSGGVAAGGCFIATAAYGSPFESQVVTLRRYRDRVLARSNIGRQMIRLYCSYSPPLADYIADKKELRRVVRWTLLPAVAFSRISMAIGTIWATALPLLGFLFVVAGRVLIRRRLANR